MASECDDCYRIDSELRQARKENERLQAELKHKQIDYDAFARMKAENERLRLQYKGCKEERIAEKNRADAHWAKIEAALAIPKDRAFDLSEGEIIEWMVKALRGGNNE